MDPRKSADFELKLVTQVSFDSEAIIEVESSSWIVSISSDCVVIIEVAELSKNGLSVANASIGIFDETISLVEFKFVTFVFWMENEGRSEVVDMCLYVRFALSTYFQHFWTEFESEKILPSDFRFF